MARRGRGAPGELGQGAGQRLRQPGRYGEREGHQRAVRRLAHDHAPGPQLVLEPAGLGVPGVDLDHLAPLPAQHPRLVQRERDRLGVGPDQPADPEQRAAEPPAHHGHDVADLATAQGLQHRRTGRPGRLTVVAGARGAGVRAEDEGRAVVPGVPVPLARRLDHLPGRRLVSDPLQPAAEPRAPRLDLDVRGARGHEVGGRPGGMWSWPQSTPPALCGVQAPRAPVMYFADAGRRVESRDGTSRQRPVPKGRR